MWTLVNIDFAVKTLRKYTSSDSKGDVNFIDFAKDILTGISKACGGFNEFRIVPDDDSRCVRIFDDRVVPNFKYETSKYLEIPILGKNSIVYDFSYTSKISPNMASQIVIAAQAQEKGVKGNKNSLAFSHLNGGLTNRLSPTRVEAAEDSSSTKPDESTLSKYLELRDQLVTIYNGTPTEALVTEEDIKAQDKANGNKPDPTYGNYILKEELLRGEVEKQFEFIYGEMLRVAKGLKPEGTELQNLAAAIVTVRGLIKDDDLSGAILARNEKDKTVTVNKQKYAQYIHDLIEDEYATVYDWKDTEIEEAWSDLAIKQTGFADASWNY
jgi:hypothetical protein